MAEEIKKFPILKICAEAFDYAKMHSKTLCIFWIVNFLFLAVFEFIKNGFSNPLSMLWLAFYYIYWCVFFRIYYNKKPYLLTCDIFGSLIPSTKMFFLVIAMSLFLGVLPYLPLLMGFDDQYLLLFERYMQQLQAAPANTLDMLILSAIFMLFSPLILCRPFLAWISSLQGLNGSLKKAWKKTSGNYWRFVLIMIGLNLPCVIAYELDLYLKCNGWLIVAAYSVSFIYYNLVFAKLYDFFYTE